MKCESPNCKDDAYCIIAMMGHDKHNVYHGDLNIVCGFHERLYRQVAEHSQIYYESRLLEPSLFIRQPAIKFQEVMAKHEFNPFMTFFKGPTLEPYDDCKQKWPDAYLNGLIPEKEGR